MKKTVMTVVLVLTLLLSCFSSNAFAVSQSEVQSRLNECLASYPAGNYWYDSFDGGDTCYGFGKMIVYKLFGKYSDSRYRSFTYNGTSTSGMNTVGSVTSYDYSNMYSLLAKAKPGDVLQFDQPKQHTMIVYAVNADANQLTVYDCNWSSRCQIDLRTVNLDCWSGRNSRKLTLLRSNNYDVSGGSSSSSSGSPSSSNGSSAPRGSSSGSTSAAGTLVAADYCDAYNPDTSQKIGRVYPNDVTKLIRYDDSNLYLICPWEGGKSIEVKVKMSDFRFTCQVYSDAYSDQALTQRIGRTYPGDVCRIQRIVVDNKIKFQISCPWPDSSNMKTVWIDMSNGQI